MPYGDLIPMPTRSKWQRIKPGCYAEQLPVVHLYNMNWIATVAIGTYVNPGAPVKPEYKLFDGVALRRITLQPTHWRVLATPPYVSKHVRKPRLAWRAELLREAKAKHAAMVADRALGLSWHRVAARHGYRTGGSARESFAARAKYLAREQAALDTATAAVV